MVRVCFVARVVDGLILVESWDNVSRLPHGLKQQAQQVLRKVRHGPQRCSVEGAGSFVFHYCIQDGVCYMALCDQFYPKGLAFAFLEDIRVNFYEELKREFGTQSVDYQSRIDTIEKPYYFIHLDRMIQKRKSEYQDHSSSRSVQMLNANLSEVSNIMRENINDMLQRGESLEEVGRKGSDLKQASSGFASMARSLSLYTVIAKYAAFIAIIVGALVMISLKVLDVTFTALLVLAVVAVGALVGYTNAVPRSAPAPLSMPLWQLAGDQAA